MRISEIMSKEVETVGPTCTVDEAADLMRQKHIRHLVIARDGDVLGVVSDRDMRSPRLFGERLTDVMSDPAITIRPNDTVRTAANRMNRRRVGSLPVVERGKLVGIVTVTDLLRVLSRG